MKILNTLLWLVNSNTPRYVIPTSAKTNNTGSFGKFDFIYSTNKYEYVLLITVMKSYFLIITKLYVCIDES